MRKTIYWTLFLWLLLTTTSYAKEQTVITTGNVPPSEGVESEYLPNVDMSILTIEEGIRIAQRTPLYADVTRAVLEKELIIPPVKWHIENYPIHQLTNKTAYQSTTIAIIDTGVTLHKSLQPNLLPGKNVLTNTEDVTDQHGHGTQLASIAKDVIGSMPVSILPIKATENGTFTLSNIIKAIDYAIAEQVDVINLSFGATMPNGLEYEAIQAAVNQGIVVISSSGNNGNETYYYPASYEEVISVGSIDEQEVRSVFSTYNEMVDFVAPGEDLVALTNQLENPEKIVRGTSFSSAYFAAEVAVLKALYEPVDFEQEMSLYTKDLGQVGKDSEYGYGLLDAVKAGEMLRGDEDIREINDQQKTWTIKFNAPANLESDTIRIIDKNKELVLTNKVWNDKQTVVSLTPISPIEPGLYWLIVPHQLSSSALQPLEKAAYVQIIVK